MATSSDYPLQFDPQHMIGKQGNHLFTSQLRAKAGEADGERLEGRQRLPVVHCKRIVLNLPKLQDHRFLVSDTPWTTRASCGDKLEVLHGGDGHPAMEI